MTPALVLTGLSVRMMSEQAVRDGYSALALDVFGDVDTRRVAAAWAGIGAPADLRIDAGRFLAGLARFADHEGVFGWVAGSGFEDRPELIEAGAQVLPLLGTPASAVRRVRDPRAFFAFLDAQGIAHPAVRFAVPSEGGWLSKDAGGAGGWHIRPAEDGPEAQDAPQRRYYQRQAPGTPMSALFVAQGGQASVLGFNELIVRGIGRHPFVYCGAIGPVPIAAEVAAAIEETVRSLAAAFALQGLCSLDFLLDGPRFAVLEVNARPSASMALYTDASPMRAHVQACLHGRVAAAPQHAEVRGTQIVFARRAMRIDARQARYLASLAFVHDLPAAGAVFAEGDPLCSVSAAGADPNAVRARLDARCDALLNHLETVDESPLAHA